MSERAETRSTTGRPEGIGVPGPLTAGVVLLGLAALNAALDAFAPDEIPDYATSATQILGITLMTTLLPPYLIVATWLGQMRSLDLVNELRTRLPDPQAADAAIDTIRGALRDTWKWGLPIGLFLSIFNTDPLGVLTSETPRITLALSLGQILMWAAIGLLFSVRIAIARALRGLAEAVPLDLLRPDRLKPLARAGLIDVAIIAGAMLLTPLQSIDAEFRWYSYRFGLLVSLPSAAFFLLWPIQPLYRRNQAERAARLEAVDRQLGELGDTPPASAEAAQRLEGLLAHRDRLLAARTWPLGMRMLSRVFLYLVLPPLAWAGAALVERVVDALLG